MADQSSDDPVLAIDPARRDNADLIYDVHRLGYIPTPVFDATVGPHAVFWKRHRPADLTTNDIRPDVGDHSWDYTTDPPEEWRSAFMTVVFDPVYKLNGTPTDDDRYGADQAATVSDRLFGIARGAFQCSRLVRRGGFLLAKSQAQVSNGVVHWQPGMIETAVQNTGSGCVFRKVDELHLLHNARKQRSQRHARRNYSTLSVFRRTK